MLGGGGGCVAGGLLNDCDGRLCGCTVTVACECVGCVNSNVVVIGFWTDAFGFIETICCFGTSTGLF